MATNDEVAQAYAVMNLVNEASLQEVDSRYYEQMTYWTGRQQNHDKDHAQEQIRQLDHTYGILLRHLLMRQPIFSASSLTQQPIPLKTPSPEPEPLLSREPRYLPDMADSHDQMEQEPGFRLEYRMGDILKCRDRSVIVHAVNCQGVWGSGIALALKKACPNAFEIYANHCATTELRKLIASCLLIPPQRGDYEISDGKSRESGGREDHRSEHVVFEPRKWIACLFTSTGWGKRNMVRNNPGRDSNGRILVQTLPALREFRAQLEAYGSTNFKEDSWHTDDEKPGVIHAVKFNSGSFGVPWERTAELVDDIFDGFERPWFVIEERKDKAF